MTFQFLCPQGHLLEGEEAHMGMQCECPQCGTAFIIPTIGESAPASAPAGNAAAAEIDLAPIEEDNLDTFESASDVAPAQPAPVESVSLDDSDLEHAADSETFLHIPCPNGHELETPLDMLNQRVMCPQCGVEFRLRREKSFEYLRQQEILDRRREKFWFQLAVIAASFVGVVLVAIIVINAMSH